MTSLSESLPSGQTGEYLPLSILYIGVDHLTSRHRAHAFERLGHRVTIVDPRCVLPRSRMLNFWNHHTGCALLGGVLHKRILASIPNESFDLVFVGSSELVGFSLVKELKRRFGYVIGYNIDDPYGGRDGLRWNLFLDSIPAYDLLVVVRDCNRSEALQLGARRVIRVTMAADEVGHRPMVLTDQDRKKWSSEVAFIGTWMPERGPFLARLVKLGVPLSIFGNRWQRAPEWPILRSHWRGPAIDNDQEYPKAVQSAKVCLGLLSKGNRDLSTTRSFEIPHLGGLLCAERTSEHEALYTDGEEAIFWSTPEECAAKSLDLLKNDARRVRIAHSGRLRCLRNGTTNENVLSKVLATAGFTSKPSAVREKLA